MKRLAAALLISGAAFATIVGSPHDLSTPDGEICVFCHTPHFSSETITPLWNRKITDITAFKMYSSATLTGTVDPVPNSPSLACLSCHDGVQGSNELSAVNSDDVHALINAPGPGLDNDFQVNCLTCHPSAGELPPDWWQIGADLTDDHPVSVTYPQPNTVIDFATPPDPDKGWTDPKIPLYGGKVECPTCHDPHDNTNGLFLRVSNVGGQLCAVCHTK
ncbi:MAG: hypothetical protein GXO03_03495 [Aquificae bacterium]|nr:hypothetical protein [Aquificota bacterium]